MIAPIACLNPCSCCTPAQVGADSGWAGSSWPSSDLPVRTEGAPRTLVMLEACT